MSNNLTGEIPAELGSLSNLQQPVPLGEQSDGRDSVVSWVASPILRSCRSKVTS